MEAFPIIETINDVLPAIADRDEFIVADKGDYTVVSYVVVTSDTFPFLVSREAAIRRECRGLIFDKQGRLVRRPLHKFFNVNEREDTQQENINVRRHHVILQKLDGSLIAPFLIDDKLYWGTKMGETEVSQQAVEYIKQHPQYEKFARAILANKHTPSFEWCSRKQRIVIDYPEDKLVLTAIRCQYDGGYMAYRGMVQLAQDWNVDVVGRIQPCQLTGEQTDNWETGETIYNFGTLLNVIKNKENEEGYVIRFDNGHMLKMKADWYVRIHKTKDLVANEMKIADLIVNDQLDDVLPLLILAIDKERVERYRDEFIYQLNFRAEGLLGLTKLFQKIGDRKYFALNVANGLNPLARSIVFSIWDTPTPEAALNAVYKTVKKSVTKAKKFAEMKDQLITFPEKLQYEQA